MKQPLTLLQGLSDQDKERVLAELETSLFIKQLRKLIQNKINTTLVNEEEFPDSVFSLAATVGERRGYRTVLKLLPDPNGETNDR